MNASKSPRLPTFIIAGAPRCGTTYLYELCDAHPDIFMAKPKTPEPKFFLVDEEYARGLTYYSNTYFSSTDLPCRGEKSTNYMENAAVALRIRECIPEVKLIFILRNPVDRALSNYRWSKRNGLEDLPFADAIERETERERRYAGRSVYARPHSYVSRGFYAAHLRPFYALFERQQIKVLLLDDFAADPHRAAADLFSFLGVRSPPGDLDLTTRINATEAGTEPVPRSALAFLRDTYRHANIALSDLISRDVRSWNEADR